MLATITVDSLADNTTSDAFTTLREAITTANASADNDTIVFASSLFTGGPGTITLGSALPSIVTTTTAGTLAITGPGAATLTLTANNGNYNVLTVNSGGNASLSGVTVTGVNSTGYGALRNSGTLAIDGVSVANNYAGLGGAGVYNNYGGTLTISNSLISGNTSPGYGGGIRSNDQTTITNTVIVGNSAGSEGGGGVFLTGSNPSTISNSTIRGNTASYGGGIRSNASGKVTIVASEISDNASNIDGGGIYGGASMDVAITNSTISGNRAQGTGGGIYNNRLLSLTNVTLANNSAAAAGGIYNGYIESTVTIANTILGDNAGGDYGYYLGGGGTGPGTNAASTNNLVTQGSFAWATTVTSGQLNLGVLQNNGGPTRTQALVTGSAAISSTVLGTPTLDQRGFTRTTADVGAYSYNYAGADGIVVSQDNEKQVVLTLPATASLSDLQVAYDSTAKTVTITPVASGFSGSTTFVPSGGIAGITAGTSGGNNTVVVDLTTQTAFGGIAVVTNSGTGTTTLSGAIDLSVITAGAANQSITLSTIGGASSTSSLSFSNAIKAKGSGSITLGAGSISGSTTLVASSLSANAATGMTLATQATAFGRIGNLASGTVTIAQTGAAVLSSVVIKGDLSLTSSGAITQASGGAVSVTGTSVFDAGGFAVTLNSAINDFGGGVTVNSSASSVTIRDVNALTVASLSLATNASLTVVAGTTLAMPSGGVSTGSGNIDLQVYGSALSPSGPLTTTSGSVSLYGASGVTIASNITSTSGTITLLGSASGSGIGINTGVTVDAGSGTILLDGNDGPISFAGSLTTTSNAATAVVIQDATTVSLGTVTTGATGTLRLGYGDIYDKTNADRITGLVTQTGILTVGTLAGCVAAGATLTANNTITSINNLTSSTDGSGSFVLNDIGGITLNFFRNYGGASTFTTTGLLQFISVDTTPQDITLNGVGVNNVLGNVLYARNVTVNGGAGAISLGTSNKWSGTLSLSNTGAFDVTAGVTNGYPADGWLRLGASSIGGNLTLSGLGIVQSGILTVGGNSTFTANGGGYDIDLGSYANDLAGTVTVNSAGNIRDFKLRNVNASAGSITNLTGALATRLRDLSILYPNAGYSLPSLRPSTLRNIVVSAGGVITQAAGGITPTGTASFTTVGFAITLDDAANDFGNSVTLSNIGANDIAVTDVDDLLLAASSVGSGALSVTAVGITQSGALTQAAGAGIATFNGGAGAILLTQAGNEFTGAVSLTTTGANDASVTDATTLVLGTSSVGQNLTVAATAFSQSGAITVAGTTTLTAAAAGTDIDLATQANDLTGTVTVSSAANVRDFKLRNVNAAAGAIAHLTTAAATSLRDVSVVFDAAAYELPSLRQATLRNVVVSAGGAITQAAGGVAPTGTASFTTGSFTITLDDAANDFSGAVTLSNTGANAVAVTDIDDLQLAASSVGSGALTVTAVGITQSGAITQAAGAGTATFNAGAGAILLTQAGNEFTGAVSLTTTGANDASVTDGTALVLGTASVGRNLAAAATAFSQSGALTVAGTTTLTAAAAATDINLATQANDLAGTVTLDSAANVRDFRLRNVNAAAGAITNLTTAAATTLRDVSIAYDAVAYALPSLRQATLRNVAVSAGGAITQAAGGVAPTGTASFTTGDFAITLTDAANDFGGAVSLSNTGANDVTVVAADTIALGNTTTEFGDVTITAAGGIMVGNAITAAGNTVALESTGGSVNGGGLITAGTVNLDAATGIGNTTALNLAAASIAADSTAGKIDLNNALGTAVTVTSATTTGDSTTHPAGKAGALIAFSQSGGGPVTFNKVSSVGSAEGYGVITLTNAGGGITVAGTGVSSAGTTSTISLTTTVGGTIAVDAAVNAGLNDGDVYLASAGSITGYGLITGYSGSLIAQTGLAASASVSQGFSTISSAAGDITVVNQWGISVPNAIEATGNVSLTSWQDISLANPIRATGKTVTLRATGTAGGGGIQGSSLITADTVDLDATTGIGSTTALNLAAFFVSANTTAGVIDINNTSGTAVSVTSLTTSGGAAITFGQTGGGGIGLDGNVTSTTGTVTLMSQQGILRNSGTITAGTLNATAATGLSLTTAVTTFNTIVSTTGAISISQAGGIALPSIAAASTLTISASGAITQQAGSVLGVPSGSATFTASVANADVILDESNAFGGTIDVTASGTASVEINDSGTTSLGTLSLGTGTFTVTTTGAVTQSVAITQAAGSGAVTIATGAAAITLNDVGNDFRGTVSLTNTGDNDVAIVDANSIVLGTISVGGEFSVTAGAGGRITLVGDVSTTADGQRYLGDVVLEGGARTLSADSGAIAFGGAIDGAGGSNPGLTVTAVGDVTVTGVIGGSQSLGSLSITGNDIGLAGIGGVAAGLTGNATVIAVDAAGGADPGSITLAGEVYRTTGTQSYTGPVTLAANTTLAGTTPTFTGGVAGAGYDLALDFSGTTAITGSDFTGIRNLTTGGGGGTTLSGAITTSGTQAYGDAVTLVANTTLAGTTPTFTVGVAGAGYDLALDFSGTTVITGAGFTGIRNLSTGGGGGTTLSGAITTSGTQAYGDAVTLAANTTLAGTTPSLTAGVAGAGYDLTLDFSGTTVIAGADFTGIRNLATGGGGGTTLSGAITTSGTQTYGDAVTLAANTTLSGTTPTFTGGVAGAGYDLALDFSGTTVITGAGFTGIRNLSTGSGGGTTLSGVLTTSGTQTYGDAVTLAAHTTLAGTTSTFTGGVVGAGHDLALDFSGTTVITGAAFTGIRNLATGGSGGTTLSGAITTSGTQTFNDDVTLAADTTLNAGSASIVLAGVVSGAFGLTPITSGSGTTTLSGANTNTTTNVVSGVVILANTSPQTTAFVVSGGRLAGSGTIGTLTATGTGVVAPGTSPGTIAAAGLSLAAGTTLTIEIAGTTAGTGYDQLVVGNAGTVDLGGATLSIPSSTSIAADTVLTIVDNQGTAPVTGTFQGLAEGATVQAGAQYFRLSYTGGTGNDVTLTAFDGDIIASIVNDELVLTLMTGMAIPDLHTTFDAVANTLAVTVANDGVMVSVAGGVTIDAATDTVIVSLDTVTGFAGIVVLGTSGTDQIVIGAGGIDLRAVTSGAANQSFRIDTAAGGGDSVTIAHAIRTKGAGAVSITSAGTGGTAGILIGAGVTAGGTQVYAGSVALTADATLAGTTVATTSTLAGGGKALAITGNVSLGGAVSAVTNLSVSGTTTLAGNVTTSGTQAYTGLVTLAVNATLAGTTPTFTGGVVGAGYDLALDFSGTTSITGAGFTGIRNLSTGGGGGTTLSGAITTSGAQTYGDAVTLAANTILAGTTPTFTGGVAAAGYDLALDFSGTTSITGSGFTGIRNLSTGNGGGTTLSGAITTSGSQTYGDAVTLAANTTLTGSTPAFTGGVAAAGYDLALDFSGTTVITGSGFTGVRNLATSGGGGTSLSGSVSTTGTQVYGDAVTLADDTNLTGTTVTTSAAVTGGGKSLVISGNASVGGAISGVTSYSVSGTTSLGAGVATTGTQIYTGLVTLTANVTLSGTTPTFTAGVAGGSRSLTLNFNGTTTIVGSLFTGIAALTTDAAGSTTLSGTLTTTGNQAFHDDVTLAADTTLDAGESSIVLAGVVSGAHALTPLTSGSGTTTLSGASSNATTNVVSGVVTLANASPQTTAFAVSGGTLRGTGTIGSLTGTGTGTVSPGASPGTISASSLSLASGNTLAIGIAGTTAGSGYDQLVVADGGTVILGNATLSLAASFAPTADTVLTIIDNRGTQPVSGTFAGLAEGAVVTVDTQDYRISYAGGTGNDVTLTALQTDDIVVSVSGDNQVVLRLASKGVTISDLKTVYNANANAVTITAVNGGTMFTKAAGIQVNSASGTITVSLAAIPAFAGISIVGGNGNDSITLGPGGINLSAITGGGVSQSFRIDTGSGTLDTISVGSPIIAKGGGVVSLATSSAASMAGIRLSASVTTASGSQAYAGPVVLVADTSLATGLAGDVTFSGTLDGARVLTVASGGQVRFLGDVGAATPLRGVTVSKASGVSVASAFALSGVGAGSKADGLTIAAGVDNVVFSDGYTGSGRVISGFGGSGIRLAGSSAASRLTGITSTKNGTGLRVDAGSYATTVIAGCSFNGNMNTGVSLTSARGLALGTAAAGNAIASNGSWGVFATGNLTGTQVQNNSIDGNGKFGVYLRAATGLQFGGSSPNAGNRIANTIAAGAYSTGLYATGKCTGTLVEGNTIRSNGGNGVMLVDAQRITIGGVATGAGNVIDLNGGFGLAASGTCTGSLVQGNTITNNARGAVNVRNAKGIRVV